jgi:tripartite-type tricarboxylate transporter receptor subunit TctC
MGNPHIPSSHSAGAECRKTAPTRRAAAGVIFRAGAGSIAASLAPWARLAAMAALVPMPGTAQVAYPVRPVRIVVPFAPGGGADLIARMLTPHLQRRLEQSFFVDNRAGAAGRIGAAAVAKADPDGHTLLMTTESSIVIAPHIGVAMTYDPIKDFAPVSLLTRNPVVLIVHPSVPAATLADYIALARAKPGQTFYASSGAGGPNHLAGEIFKQMTGVDIVHVPYPGTGAAIPAVISNQVGAMWGFLAGLLPHIRSGGLRALAIGSKQRSPALPEVPTVAEAGVPGYEASSWIGLLAPAATPPPVIARLWDALNSSMQAPAVKDILLRDGSDIVVSAPDAFGRVIRDDDAKYAKLSGLFATAK